MRPLSLPTLFHQFIDTVLLGKCTQHYNLTLNTFNQVGKYDKIGENSKIR